MGDMYNQVWGLSSMKGSVDGPRRDSGSSKKLLPCWEEEWQRDTWRGTEDGEGTGNQRFLIQTQQ